MLAKQISPPWMLENWSPCTPFSHMLPSSTKDLAIEDRIRVHPPPFSRPSSTSNFAATSRSLAHMIFYSIFGLPRLNLRSWIKNISMLDLKPQRFLPSDKVVIKARYIEWEEVYFHVLRFDVACALAILSFDCHLHLGLVCSLIPSVRSGE